jgi:molybdate transport system permease protein
MPLPIGFLAVTGAAFLVLPILGLLVRAPWSEVLAELASRETLDALGLSLLCSISATALCLAFGVPLAWVLARMDFPGRNLVRAAATLPMVLPPVVGGVALLLAFGRRGLVGAYLFDWLGIRLPFSTAGAILAETFVAMPFLVVTVEAGLRSMDLRLEDAARTLGATPSHVFRRVTLPLVAPAIFAGAVLSWSRALGEFGATITFAGNFPGRTQTAPLAVYLLLQTRPGAALVLSLVLVLSSFAVLVALRDRYLKFS